MQKCKINNKSCSSCSKENPIITNKDKLKEMRDNIMKTFNCNDPCFECDKYMKIPSLLCNKFTKCEDCINFWNSEYKEGNNA